MLFLSIKQLLSRPGRTLLALLGIIFGTAAFFILSSTMLGFRELLIQRIINNNAHIRISAEENVVKEHSLDDAFFPGALVRWIVPPVSHNDIPHLENPQGWFDRLENDDAVFSYAPQMTAQALLIRGKLSKPINLIGVDAEKQVRASDIQSNMVRGSFLDLSKGGFQIVIGEALAQKMGIHLYDTVDLVDKNGEVVPAKVAGLYATGVRQLDEGTAYGPIFFVGQMNRTPGQISTIIVRVKDISRAAEIATGWAGLSREKVESWDQANANFLNIFKTQDLQRYILSFVVLLIAAFGIYNILNMIVLQKRGEIAILRSMGFEASDVVVLFMSQGVILGFIGGILGLLVGTLVCLYLQTIRFAGGLGMGGGSDHMILAWHFHFYISGFLLAFLSGILAGYFPARSASRMSPIDVLRSEG